VDHKLLSKSQLAQEKLTSGHFRSRYTPVHAPLAEREDGVDVGLVVDGELERTVPVEQPHVHVDRPVRQFRLQPNTRIKSMPELNFVGIDFLAPYLSALVWAYPSLGTSVSPAATVLISIR